MFRRLPLRPVLALLVWVLGAGAPALFAAAPTALVYVPVDPCIVARTVTADAGKLTANEARKFLVRGETTDLSSQGGSSTGCAIPALAQAVAMSFRAVQADGQGQVREPTTALLDYRPGSGGNHTCALRTDGSLACWGDNSAGEVSPIPAGAYTQVAAGLIHNCGLTTDGSTVCWGFNAFGQSAPPPYFP